MALENEIIEQGGRHWKVRQAKSREHALDAIAMARAFGSVGHKDTLLPVGEPEQVLADVVQINSDGTERQPYTESY